MFLEVRIMFLDMQFVIHRCANGVFLEEQDEFLDGQGTESG